MGTYQYRACKNTGQIVEDTIQAADSNEAYQQLEKNELVPIYIRLSDEKVEKERKVRPGLFSPRIKGEDIIVFTRQLSTMLKAGMPIYQAVEVLKDQTENRALQQVLSEVGTSISGGSSLSEALSSFPKIFPSQYVSLVFAGESGGDLVKVLLNIAEWMERELEIRTEIKSALRYPLMVFVALIAVGIIMLIFVIPRFAGLFERSAAVELPLPTRILIAGNTIIQHYWLAVVGVIIAVGLTIFFLQKNPLIRLRFDALKFRLPISGPVYTKIMISRFSRVFSMLVKNGVTVLSALDIAPSVVPNTSFQTSLRDAKQKIKGGSSIFEAFGDVPVFPPMMTNLIAIGEKAGNLDEMLEYVVLQYNMDIKYALKNLTTMIEPIITVVMASAVLFLALAVFLPIWNISQVLKQ